ncbi:MAG: hypothetical protein COA78_01510 [Blastopirellula sp.]|nr:MAG: hypothetical protein COA78_01510 [Blastopirellula sp.]
MFRINLILLLLLSTRFAVAEEWQVTKSQEGNFQIELPGEPEYSSRVIDNEAGKVKLHIFTLTETKSGIQVFMLMYNDFSDEVLKQKTTDQLLTDAADGVKQNFKGKLLSDKKITSDKIPGKEFDLTSTKNGRVMHIHWRLLLAKNRMYQIACMGIDKKVPDETVKRVRESFQLLK